MSDNRERSYSRRNLLKATSVGIGLAGFSTLASARLDESSPLRTVKLNTAPFDHLSSARVEFFEDEQMAVEAEGDVPVQAGPPGFSITIEDLANNRGEYTPYDAVAHVTPLTRDGGRDRASSDNGGNIGTMTDGDFDETESGKDHTEDFVGGLKTEISDGWYWAVHGQTAEWTCSNNEVDWVNRYWCYDMLDYDHQAGGFNESDWSGDTYVSGTYSQFQKSNSGYYSWHYTELTLEPDGQMGWWGRIKTDGVDQSTDNHADRDFILKDSYWQNCEDWATS